MKKISVFLLTLVAGISLAACGSKTTAKKTTQAPAPAPTPTPDPTPQTYNSKSAAEVLTALGDKFMFGITMQQEEEDSHGDPTGQIVSYDMQFAIDGNNIAMMSETEGGMYIKNLTGGDYYMYLYDSTVNGYTTIFTMTEDDAEDYSEIDISMASGLEVKYTAKQENFSFIGRTCTQYTYTYKEGSANLTDTYVFDNETGVCLKYDVTSSAKTGSIEKAGLFEVTEFKMGDDVDDFFATQESRILVQPWDVAFMGSHYFDKVTTTPTYTYVLDELLTNYTGTKPAVNLITAYDLYNDGHQYIFSSTFELDGDDEDVVEFIRYVAENLYQCGAKYNDNGVIDTYDNLVIETIESTKVTGLLLEAFTASHKKYSVSFDFMVNNPYSQKPIFNFTLTDINFAPGSSLA